MTKQSETPEQIEAAARTIDPNCKREGSNWVMRDPSSNSQKRHALSMHCTKGTWADFSGTAKGSSAATLLIHYKGMSRAEATKALAEPAKGLVVAPAAQSKPTTVWPAGPQGDQMPDVLVPAGYKLVQGWCYKNAEGRQILWVFRFDGPDGKTFRPYHWDEGWVAGDPAGLLPMFNIDQMALRPEAHLLVTEGEKSALAAEKLFKGMVSTTSSHGANSASKTDWSASKGRHLIVWPDHDEPGVKYAQEVAKFAYAAGALSVRIVEIPSNFPAKWDLADPKPQGADLKQLLKDTVLVPRLRQLIDLVMSLGDFMAQPIKPRDYLVFPWLCSASLNMAFGPRGIGKSFWVHKLALCLAMGEEFFAWRVTRHYRVLLIDGEMPKATLQKRFRLLAGMTMPSGLDLLSSEDLWLEGTPLNLNEKETQQRFQQMLDGLVAAGKRPDLIIFDNLSSLTAGTDENDNGALDGLLHWLMGLRHQGYAVLLIHHSGKGGDQRGASRREDLLDTVIKLEKPKSLPEPAWGACFQITFSKTREESPDPYTLTVELGRTAAGDAQWKTIQPLSDDLLILKAIDEEKPESQNALADAAGLARGAMNKKLEALVKKGWVKTAKAKNKTLITLTAIGSAELHGMQSLATPKKDRKYS